MASSTGKALFCYCSTGGCLVTRNDGTTEYEGGITEGVSVDETTTYYEFVTQVCEKLGIELCTATVKYCIKNNAKRAVTLSSQKDIQNMIKFNDDTVEVFVLRPGESLEHVRLPARECVTTMPMPRVERNGGNVTTMPPVEKNGENVTTLPENEGGSVTEMPAVENDSSVVETSSSDAFATDEPLLSAQWEDCITGIGQSFDTIDGLRLALNKFSIAHRFAYSYVRNSKLRSKAKCVVEGCQWKLFASYRKKEKKIIVYEYNGSHIHPAESSTKLRISKNLIASLVVDKVRESPNYQPMQIVKDFSRELAVNLKYKQAWRGKAIAHEEIRGLSKDSLNKLQWFCEKISESNPGSFVMLTQKESRFNQMFIAFYASLHGFQSGCRPLLFLNNTLFKGRYKGSLLSASAVDADNNIFPVAFAVVNSVTYDDWKWFFSNLKVSLNDDREVIFVSDRNPYVVLSIEEVCGSTLHSRCFSDLKQNFISFLRGLDLPSKVQKTLVELLGEAAYARLDVDYDRSLSDIRFIMSEAYDWLVGQSPEHWANSKFPGKRYNLLTLDVECYNTWLLEARNMPIAGSVDKIRTKMMDLLNKRREEVWKCPVGDSVDVNLKKNIVLSERLEAHQSSTYEYEIRGGRVYHCVNLQNRTCSCNDWNVSGLPCIHACAALRKLNKDVYLFVDDCYKRSTQELIYSQPMRPLCTYDMPRFDCIGEANIDGEIIYSPKNSWEEGIAKKQRIDLQGLPKHKNHCSCCKEKGHNSRTCKSPI